MKSNPPINHHRMLSWFPSFALCAVFSGSLLMGMLSPQSVTGETVDVWFGTATPRGGLSKGIYYGQFDTESGKLSSVELAAAIEGPGFLAKHPNGDVLYAAASDQGTPSIVAYRIDRKGGKATLSKDSSVAVGDGGAAHVSVTADGRVVLSAQYGAGSTACFSLSDSGSLIARTDLQEHPAGSGVIKGRQEEAHAHWTGTSPDGRFVFVPDLGMDKVVIYRLDTEHAKLTPHGYGVCPPGSGPRHMKFHPNGRIIYVLNELSLSVTVFQYDAAQGEMNPIQTIETLPESVKAKEVFNSSSEIRIHPSGRFVYAANRGNDTITAYSVDANDGTLTLVEVEPIRGAWPRNFNLDPTGKWLLAAGQESNNVAIFAINQDTGELQFTKNSVFVPQSICVLF